MTMKPPRVLACALAFCAVAAAQVNPWPAVQALSPGSSLQVHLLGGKVVKGKFAAITPLGLDLQTSPNSTRYIARAQISQVYLTKQPHKEKTMVRDSLIGAGAGAIFGAAYLDVIYTCYHSPGYGPCQSKSKDMGLGAAIFGGIGALFGAAIGALQDLLHHSKTLIYQRNASSPHVLRRTPTQKDSEISPHAISARSFTFAYA